MRRILVLTLLLSVFALEAPVAAYLDPGSGSMILQVLLGGVAAVGVVARLYWHRVMTLLRKPGEGENR